MLNHCDYHKVASSRLSWLVALPRIFRMLMNGIFDAYVLWPLAKKFQNWIVDRSTACDFTVPIRPLLDFTWFATFLSWSKITFLSWSKIIFSRLANLEYRALIWCSEALIWLARGHELQTPNEAFFHWNPELLGRQIGEITSGAFGVFSA